MRETSECLLSIHVFFMFYVSILIIPELCTKYAEFHKSSKVYSERLNSRRMALHLQVHLCTSQEGCSILKNIE